MNKPIWAINLRKARKEKNLTQQEVAERIFKDRSTYSGYENGDQEPSVETWKLLWDLFRIVDPLKFWTQDYYEKVTPDVSEKSYPLQ